MAIIIKDMQEPVSCVACVLNRGATNRRDNGLTISCPFSKGIISDERYTSGREKLPTCGIVPVQSLEHLKDFAKLEDAIVEESEKYSNSVYGCGVQDGLAMALELADNLPNIIEEKKKC